ncbi:unnamed protein product, partial [Amoebophrya sp. A120]|eukprot:GSA120T00025796001.1
MPPTYNIHNLDYVFGQADPDNSQMLPQYAPDPDCPSDDAFRVTLEITAAPTTVKLPIDTSATAQHAYTIYWDDEMAPAFSLPDSVWTAASAPHPTALSEHTYTQVGWYHLVVR